MKPYSVNEAMDNAIELHGQRIYLEGLLTFQMENVSMCHWPKSEDRGSSIWVEQGEGVFRYNEQALERLSAKKVICLGEFHSVLSEENFDWYWGYGHLGCWSAQIVARELVYYKKWYQANGMLDNK